MAEKATDPVSPPATGGYDPDDHVAASDARTLHEAEQIKMDPNRHQKAAAHLGQMRSSITSAHANARRSLLKKTGSRLKSVFGEGAGEQDKTPFEEAEENH